MAQSDGRRGHPLRLLRIVAAGSAVEIEQVILLGYGPEHGIRLNELDLRGEKRLRLHIGRLRRLLAHHLRWRLMVDIHRRGGFINRLQAGGDDGGGKHACRNEGDDLPAMPAQNPQVVGKRNRRRLRFEVLRLRGGRIVGYRRRASGCSRRSHLINSRLSRHISSMNYCAA